MPMLWNSMSVEEREVEYSPSSCLVDGDYLPFVSQYVSGSAAAVTACADAGIEIKVIRYGEAASQTINLVAPPGVESPPLLVFIHGGYWQELSKVDSFFAATDALNRGWAFAAIDYTLAPQASIGEIVDECVEAVNALHAQASRLGLDSERVFVAGSSAGGHLAAMVAGRDVAAATGTVAGVVLISGVFELEPLIGTSVNEATGLDLETARALSPLLLSAADFPPALIVWGDNETAEFKAQSRAFAAHLEAAGIAVVTAEIERRNHFDIVMDMAAPNTPLGKAVANLIG